MPTAPNRNPRFQCHGCKRNVNGSGRAVIHVDMSEVNRAEQEQAAWDKEHDGMIFFPLPELMTYPEPARWEVHCDDCNPHRDDDGFLCGGCYWWTLARCRTSTDLLYWTAHLMGKVWLAATNWDEFIRSAAATTGRLDP